MRYLERYLTLTLTRTYPPYSLLDTAHGGKRSRADNTGIGSTIGPTIRQDDVLGETYIWHGGDIQGGDLATSFWDRGSCCSSRLMQKMKREETSDGNLIRL